MAEVWLPAPCWCEERTIAVKRVDVLDGITASCGAPSCVGPSGRRVVGHFMPANPSRWPRFLRSLPAGYAPAPRHHGSAGVPKEQQAAQVALRRAKVLVWLRRGYSLAAIARVLDVSPEVVRNDVNVLRAEGLAA